VAALIGALGDAFGVGLGLVWWRYVFFLDAMAMGMLVMVLKLRANSDTSFILYSLHATST
jgi:hypothetical protein